ncbi:GTP cyclohydrolase I [Amaricoccus sp.]|uniref:GTP cyclohydrolase I n=1 Tax=Amaricoccus sp. TaxID=1872485 RepID=UPI001B5465D0|nr:GTP cyclohydrolase I [Amaricoccus sp.]MBP7001995.1 GTP cyclohydrolase I [Amaricoccus sp.]
MTASARMLDQGGTPIPFERRRPERAEAEAAFRTIIHWTGDDSERDGLTETPARVARAFEEFFAGCRQDPALVLRKTYGEIKGRDETVMPRRRPLRASASPRPSLPPSTS